MYSMVEQSHQRGGKRKASPSKRDDQIRLRKKERGPCRFSRCIRVNLVVHLFWKRRSMFGNSRRESVIIIDFYILARLILLARFLGSNPVRTPFGHFITVIPDPFPVYPDNFLRVSGGLLQHNTVSFSFGHRSLTIMISRHTANALTAFARVRPTRAGTTQV